MKEFTLSTRVYYEDTDAAGLVYHCNYLKYMERTRTEWLRELGFTQENLRKNENIIFTVRNLKMKFIQPAILDDLLTLKARILRSGGAHIIFEQEILREQLQLCVADIDIACLDATTYKPIRIPKTLKANLNHDN